MSTGTLQGDRQPILDWIRFTPDALRLAGFNQVYLGEHEASAGVFALGYK